VGELSEGRLLIVEIPFDKYVAQAMQQVERSQVPDLPDRIIAATALSLKLPLISRDRKIQMSSVETIW
jgi:predicted nucleic acid-binding protein